MLLLFRTTPDPWFVKKTYSYAVCVHDKKMVNNWQQVWYQHARDTYFEHQRETKRTHDSSCWLWVSIISRCWFGNQWTTAADLPLKKQTYRGHYVHSASLLIKACQGFLLICNPVLAESCTNNMPVLPRRGFLQTLPNFRSEGLVIREIGKRKKSKPVIWILYFQPFQTMMKLLSQIEIGLNSRQT